MSKFADDLEDISQSTAEYIRMLEQSNAALREEKNYLLHKAGENLAEIAELRDKLKRLTSAMRDCETENAILKDQNSELISTLVNAYKFLVEKK